MFKVEIELRQDSDKKGNEALRAALDKLFLKQGISSAQIDDKRFEYIGSESGQDYGKFWAALFEIKSQECLVKRIEKCIWIDGIARKDLLVAFLIG